MSRLRSLQDFIAAGVETVAECKGCGRRVRADPRKLLAGIAVKWRQDLAYQGSKLRCTVCLHKGARLAPVPKIVSPLDCEGFRADIRRMWENVMADEALGLDDWVIEGPDGEGFVWVCSAKGREDWCRNLGTVDEVAEKLSQFLGSIDYQENE